jgi:hypothetical protein
MTKPKFVTACEQAEQVLEKAASAKVDEKAVLINEAHAWMRLADIYRGAKAE